MDKLIFAASGGYRPLLILQDLEKEFNATKPPGERNVLCHVLLEENQHPSGLTEKKVLISFESMFEILAISITPALALLTVDVGGQLQHSLGLHRTLKSMILY